jgi:hypothetical protein
MIDIEKTEMRHEKDLECIEEQVEEFKSPIKSIEMSILKHESMLFTSIEKQMFGGECECENNQHEINKSVTLDNINKIKINPQQFFSIQRLPKQELTHFEEKIEDEDGLVLVEAGFNLIKNKNKDKTEKENGNLNEAVGNKKKQNARYHQKRRQLIITGSSPYLEYLPDMMKKEKLLRKSHNTPSQTQIPTMSRKIL